MLFYFAIHRMDGCNWNCKLIKYFWNRGWLQVLVSKKHSTLEDTRSLQEASWNNDGTTEMYGCMCSFETTERLKRKCLSNTLYIGNSWPQVLFWKTPYPLRNGWPQLKKQRNTVLWKKLRLIIVTYKENMFLWTTTLDHSFFLYFTMIFVHLPVIETVCSFSVYKLIGWDPVNQYLFKVISKTLEKGVEYGQS